MQLNSTVSVTAKPKGLIRQFDLLGSQEGADKWSGCKQWSRRVAQNSSWNASMDHSRIRATTFNLLPTLTLFPLPAASSGELWSTLPPWCQPTLSSKATHSDLAQGCLSAGRTGGHDMKPRTFSNGSGRPRPT